MNASDFAPLSWRDSLREDAITLWHWVHSNVHNSYITFRVLDYIYWHRLGSGILSPDHPWATGAQPEDGTPIWPHNILYASPRRKTTWKGPEPEPDDVIVTKIGAFMAAMVQRSTVAEPGIPQGPKRRMPHAVNLLHGTVQYNGGFLIFDDFLDAKFHLSDRNFVREIRKFATEAKREITVVCRERTYDPTEYAWFVTYLRSRVPWYANPNGPTPKRVLWGTPSPYAAVNPINGSWVGDVWTLTKPDAKPLVRPPIEKGHWFQGIYRGNQPNYSFLVRFHAWFSYLYVKVRKFQGGLLFTSRKRIEPENWKRYLESNKTWRPGYPVPHPFRRGQGHVDQYA